MIYGAFVVGGTLVALVGIVDVVGTAVAVGATEVVGRLKVGIATLVVGKTVVVGAVGCVLEAGEGLEFVVVAALEPPHPASKETIASREIENAIRRLFIFETLREIVGV
jgi:hypothetical protein